MRKRAGFALLLSLSACTTARSTSLPVPKERASECATHCETLGMRLSAVVIIMNAAGCVCEPTTSPPAASAAPGAAAVAGGAAIAVAAAAQQAGAQQSGAAGTGIRR